MPARWDHPDRKGPWAAQAATVTVSTTALAAAVTLRPVGAGDHLVDRRHASGEYRQHAPDVESLNPADTGVGTGSETVHDRERPAGVRAPVDRPPRLVADPVADQAAESQGDQQVS